MKKIALLLCALGLPLMAFGHDESHGPKISDTGKYGGLVRPVVNAGDAKLGTKAGLVYKAELVRSTDGTLRVYLYDKNMKALDGKSFDAKASALLGAKVKGKWKNSEFSLNKKDSSFVGKMPKPETKPYSIDVHLNEGNAKLLAAFDNLD